MNKTALLPDGKVIHFPADMHDEAIDRAVKSLLGVDAQAKDEALAGVLMALQDITQMLGAVAQGIQALAQNNATAQISSQIDTLGAALVKSNQAVMQAVTAPREVVTPDGRRFTSNVKQNVGN